MKIIEQMNGKIVGKIGRYRIVQSIMLNAVVK
jgi:hypothetical protein